MAFIILRDNSRAMLKFLRDITRWPALFSGIIIFSGQWCLRDYYVKFENSKYVDYTPPILNLLGVVLTFSTLALGLFALPRWQSFLALLAFLWVMFMFVQGY